ncbi:MAG: bacillithiol biosynthesis cysteine-adding enzyme BshC [Candidatus Kapabacteria bacterium]|nr:bacillithiol biosynthesis cysteine-adding enzyme BshC [Candidatus Kapabacteria bacterium]
MRLIDPETIGTSATARAFMAGEPLLTSRFRTPSVTPEFCTKRALQGASRSRLRELITSSMVPLELSAVQVSALEKIDLRTSVVVATGQQIGMLGGPMYTLYKIRTAVAEARRIESSLGVPAVAVFWLEDNDHDAAEAAHLTLPGANSLPTAVSVWDNDQRRLPVSMRLCDTDMQDRVAEASSLLAGPQQESTQQRIQQCWSSGTSWGDAFMAMLAPYLQQWGVLVVRASEVIRSGMHQPLVMMEIEKGAITEALRAGTDECNRIGLGAQAQVPEFGFFVIDNNERRRPTPGEQGLAETAQTHPDAFSPSVLTRPLVQDALLPTVMNVLGAAELAYHAQLSEAYSACGIEQPVVVIRHGATLCTLKIQRLLSKSETTVEFYLRAWSDIERTLADDLTQEMFPDSEHRAASVASLLAPYRSAAERTDSTLIATVESQRAGITASLEALEGKIRAAAKRRNAGVIDRARTIHASVMPNDTLQERVYPLAVWEAQVGIDGIISALDAFDAVGAGHHCLIELPAGHASA